MSAYIYIYICECVYLYAYVSALFAPLYTIDYVSRWIYWHVNTSTADKPNRPGERAMTSESSQIATLAPCASPCCSDVTRTKCSYMTKPDVRVGDISRVATSSIHAITPLLPSPSPIHRHSHTLSIVSVYIGLLDAVVGLHDSASLLYRHRKVKGQRRHSINIYIVNVLSTVLAWGHDHELCSKARR